MKVLLFLTLIAPTGLHAQDSPPPCNIGQLSVEADPQKGGLEGSRVIHVSLHLRNVSTSTCSVPSLPKLTFDDAGQQPLDLLANFQARGANPYPPSSPQTLPPGTQFTALLKWRTNDSIIQETCLHTVTLTYHLDPETRSIPFEATFCGEPKPTYVFTRLRSDPSAGAEPSR